MIKKNIVASEIKTDIGIILQSGIDVALTETTAAGKIFSLSDLRAGLFKANYSAREINATLAGFNRRGLMKPVSDQENEINYVFSKKVYE